MIFGNYLLDNDYINIFPLKNKFDNYFLCLVFYLGNVTSTIVLEQIFLSSNNLLTIQKYLWK